jgi:3-phenylpropionate/cinnamic acid dioxygenase small subunit
VAASGSSARKGRRRSAAAARTAGTARAAKPAARSAQSARAAQAAIPARPARPRKPAKAATAAKARKAVQAARPPARSAAYQRLQAELAAFLYEEAELLDARRFEDWLALLAEDLLYFMPMRHNVRSDEQAALENTRLGRDISWFEEDKWTLAKRVEQIRTGVHWAEEPLSRVCHLVSNVQVLAAVPSLAAPREVTVRSRFLVYQNRVQYETYTFVGKRTDILRRHGDSWLIARREITLDQSILQAKNLSVFF